MIPLFPLPTLSGLCCLAKITVLMTAIAAWAEPAHQSPSCWHTHHGQLCQGTSRLEGSFLPTSAALFSGLVLKGRGQERPLQKFRPLSHYLEDRAKRGVTWWRYARPSLGLGVSVMKKVQDQLSAASLVCGAGGNAFIVPAQPLPAVPHYSEWPALCSQFILRGSEAKVP